MKSNLAAVLLPIWAAAPLVRCAPPPTGATNTLKQSYYPPGANCQDYLIPIEISYQSLPFNATQWENDYELTSFLVDATTRSGAGYPAPLGLPQTVAGHHKIAASFCTPKKTNGKEKTVILATHGIGPGRDHWNFPVQPENYNFVQWATGQGYSVFFYDRLGCGASDR